MASAAYAQTVTYTSGPSGNIIVNNGGSTPNIDITEAPNFLGPVTLGVAPTGAFTASPALSVLGLADIPLWSTVHTSSFGGCPVAIGASISTAINLAIAHAATLAANGQSVKVIIDCGGVIAAPIVLPTASVKLIIDQQMVAFTVAAGYSQDIYQMPYNSSARVGIENVYLNYPRFPEPTAGAVFDMQNCTGCFILHFRFSGAAYDLFELGFNAISTTLPTHTESGNWMRSLIDDATSDVGGFFHGAAFRFNGPAGNDVFSNFVFSSGGVPQATGSPPVLPPDGVGVIADTTTFVQPTASPGSSPIPEGNLYPNWDVLSFFHGDFEQIAAGFNINMTAGLINDIFINDQIVDTTHQGPALSMIASSVSPGGSPTPGIIRRVHLTDMWFVGGNPTPGPSATASSQAAVYMAQSNAGQVYDVQITGGHAQSDYGDAIYIAPNVLGVQLTGVQEYASALCGVNDNGTDTVIIGGVDPGGLGAPGGYGGNMSGICAGSTAQGGHYTDNDLRYNTSHGITTASGAGSTSALYASGNNVQTFSGTSAFSFSSGSSITAVDNPGYGGVLSGVSCNLAGFVTQTGTPAACLDSAGDFASKSDTIGNGTTLGYGNTSHCGVTDSGFIFYNSSNFYVSGDTSGDVGICGTVTANGSLSVAGALSVGSVSYVKGGPTLAGCNVGTGGSCTTGPFTVSAGSICTTTYDASTTISASNLRPAFTSVSGTALTLTGNSVATTGTIYFNYHCT